MKTTSKILFIALSLSLIIAAGFQTTSQSHARDIRTAPKDGFADIVVDLLPAVVNISSTQKVDKPSDFPELPQFPEGSPFEDFFDEFMDRRDLGRPAVPAASLGSGFVIDAELGYIVTNNHVVKDAEQVRVTFQDDKTVDAEIIGTDEKTDLAVLKIDPSKHKISAVNFGDSDVMRVGDWVVAIGNPFGLGGTVTAGIISARQRDINSGPYDDFIQTDASINRGNSGGPMFDLNGQVIGINTAIFSPSGGSVGIGFAIPSNLAKPVIDQIIKYGRTRRGWLGVRIQQVTDEIADSLDLGKTRGALIASITPDGPAEKAKIQTGDIILKFNGQKVKEMKDLPRIVASTDIGTQVNVTLWRDGKQVTTKVTVGELEKAEEDGLLSTKPRSPAAGTKIEGTGLTLEPLNDELREEFEVSNNVNGVLITNIEDLSEAAEKGLISGDVIVEINQQPVTKPTEIKDIIDKAKQNNRTSVLLLINRAGNVQFIALKIS